MFISDKCAINHGDSIWWRDLILMDNIEDENCIYFFYNTFCRVKDENSISFWFSKWIGNQPLKGAFPELFVLATELTSSITDSGRWDNGVWSWNMQGLGLNHNVCDSWKGEELQELLTNKMIMQDEADEFEWLLKNDDIFSIKSGHEDLVSRSADVLILEEMRITINFVWKISETSNVLMFGWRWILNRIPTKDQLGSMRILIDDRDKCCTLFFKDNESKQHVFFSCEFSSKIQAAIVIWISPELGLTVEDLFLFSSKS
ncbi:hypothetical protein KIW84_015444 [Lathyrus oleraceus]|uniref:Reverse transcriptase zinc-binding domain-containing protein n=1 Tax=Pisum sativum TaxID=3888 RepID=A0A9D5H0K2_PEA|nr:hypothetical protein KIW84_015444 [Pisum sativum]